MVVLDHLTFYVNGKEIIEYHPEPEWTLLWYLRNKLRLTGTKSGCGEGGCGACTVLVSCSVDANTDEIEHRTVNACLAPLCSVNGCHVVTVEGIGSVNSSNLHATQTRLAELFASQCGFCTPGIVMSLYGNLKSKSLLTLQDMEDGFDGNLCRCTGYRPILDAAKTFAVDIEKLPNQPTCPGTSTTLDKCLEFTKENSTLVDSVKFPDRLRNFNFQSIHIKGSTIDWYAPVTLSELLELRNNFPGNQSKLVFGNTRVQIERRYHQMQCSRLISITHIKELQECRRTDEFLTFGAGVTFAKLKTKLTEWNHDEYGFCQALLEQMKYFASTQIRNVASLGGNIISASPISDINPVLEAAGAILELRSSDASAINRILLSDFFLGDHRVQMADNEVLVAIHIPLQTNLSSKSFIRSYKQAQRREDSKGIVSAGFRVDLDPCEDEQNQWKIRSVCFAFGGMASKTMLAIKTQEKLIGSLWTRETINQAYEYLLEEMPLNEMSPGGKTEYRRTLIQTFLFKFHSFVCQHLQQPSIDVLQSSTRHGISYAQQTTPKVPESQKIVGKPISHRSAYLQATGEATYVDDIPSLEGTLHAAIVMSTQSYARIKSINLDAASQIPGFVSFISHTDVPGVNRFNEAFDPEEVFASTTVNFIGQIIGLAIGTTEQIAQKAANAIQIEYEALSPVVLTIDDAIAHNSFFGSEILLNQGDVEKSLKEADHQLESEIFVGGQEHFYMEPNACMVVPSHDDNEIHLYLGTQSPTSIQEAMALVLSRDSSRIICHTKRIGGAFGGKESRATPLALAVSVAATKLSRAVRLRLERNVDFAITGHRHPFKATYKAAFNNDGRLVGVDLKMWSNAGYSLDISEAVMQLGMLHVGGCYRIPNMRIRGYVCKTNLASNTAFRGFGGPQAALISENIIEHVAFTLRKDPAEIRQLNLFKEGDVTHYGQALEQWNVPRILDELKESSDFHQRQIEVKNFNRENPYRKRGISLVPAKFGIGFVIRFLNQAGALVHIYKDGSVVISHGGVEMGQGIHTKMIAIAAEVLRCDINRIRISETATDKVPNTSPTGGSVSADINGMAVKHACEQLRERLDTLIDDKNQTISWENLITQAYFTRIDLSARGFHSTPNMFDMDFSQNRAHYNYYTQGAAVTEIELDVLTGGWHIVRADILMDVGVSLNPQLDIGQIEGAFMQGVGLYTMEELVWGEGKEYKWVKPGELFTLGPDTYKIPSANDVPIDFRVSLLSDSSNPRAVFSSKGIGEPPILLSTSVFFALKSACVAYRQDQGLSDYFTLHSPATVERLRMSCTDEFTRRVCSADYDVSKSKGVF